MPHFVYQGFDKQGQEDSGSIEANSEAVAFGILQGRGVTIVNLEEGLDPPTGIKPWYHRNISFGNGQLSLSKQAVVAELMASLFASGLPADEMVRVAMLSSEDSQIQRQFENVGDRLADGLPFAEAFDTDLKLFSPIFVAFIRISDQANAMSANLVRLASFLKKQEAVRHKVLSALIYPAILIVAAALLLLLVVFNLAPSLASVFSGVASSTPPTLTFLLNVNLFLTKYWPLLVLGIVGFATVLVVVLRMFPVSRLFEHVPIWGKLSMSRTLAQLCDATHLLMSSGMPLADAMRLSAEFVETNSPARELFRDAARAIESGQTASSVFQDSNFLPVSFREIFRVGELSNQLPKSLKTLADMHIAQSDRLITRILALITPILTLILGVGIGFLVYTVMSAILEVNEIAF